MTTSQLLDIGGAQVQRRKIDWATARERLQAQFFTIGGAGAVTTLLLVACMIEQHPQFVVGDLFAPLISFIGFCTLATLGGRKGGRGPT